MSSMEAATSETMMSKGADVWDLRRDVRAGSAAHELGLRLHEGLPAAGRTRESEEDLIASLDERRNRAALLNGLGALSSGVLPHKNQVMLFD
jgi:hypothetical protein